MTLSTPEMTEPETPSKVSDQNFTEYQIFFEANQVFEVQFKAQFKTYKETRQDYLANFKRLEKYLQNQKLPYLLQKRVVRAYLYLWEIFKVYMIHKPNEQIEQWEISLAQKNNDLMIKYENICCLPEEVEYLEPMFKQGNSLDIKRRKTICRELLTANYLECSKPKWLIGFPLINFHTLLDQISYEFRKINPDQYAICLLGKIRF